MTSPQDDIEIDADQSNQGDGSNIQSLQSPQDLLDGARQLLPDGARQLSFEAVIDDMKHLHLQSKEHIDHLELRLKKAIEEKEIWMTRCQRIESMLADAGDRDGNVAGHHIDGTKQVEHFLQENAFLKADNKRLREQLEVMNQARNESTSSDGAAFIDSVSDEEEPRAATQTSDHRHTRPDQHEMTLDADPVPSQSTPLDQSATVAGTPPLQHQSSLSGRRGIPMQQLPADGPAYVPPNYSSATADSQVSSSSLDDGDKPPNDEMFMTLAKKLSRTEYKVILRKLGVSDNKLEDIEHKYPGDAQEVRFQSLKEWRNKKGRVATIRKLVDVMFGEDMRNKAEEFCGIYNLSYLVNEYDNIHGVDDDDSVDPVTPVTPGVPEVDGPLEPEREIGPLERIIAPLMHQQESFGEDYELLLEGRNFTALQMEEFMKDQKWGNGNKLTFKQEMELLHNNRTMHNILTSWAATVHSIYDSNRGRYTEIDKRKHVWRMMQSLRKSHPDIYRSFLKEKIFPGGVLGVDPMMGRKMVNQLNFGQHNKMKLLLQQTREDGSDWRALAGKLENVDQGIINTWVQKGHDVGAENTLKTYGTSRKGTVQNLYEDLISINRCDVAQVLEDDPKL
ncbi:uncharacterized protein [Amphiura filiformis]|uniref:uncharacterized protein isoform X1 n=1 Tax=Amphiura filiformis TaxID=82378 RepID=UPI003B21D4AB